MLALPRLCLVGAVAVEEVGGVDGDAYAAFVENKEELGMVGAVGDG